MFYNIYIAVNLINRNTFTQVAKDKLLAARDACLGPKELRTRDAPTQRGSTYKGGVEFERNSHAEAVPNSKRCYTLGNSFEGPRHILAPSKGSKTASADIEALELRSNLLKVRYGIGYHLNCKY